LAGRAAPGNEEEAYESQSAPADCFSGYGARRVGVARAQFELVVNMRTAKALGIHMPESLLLCVPTR
jgi:hypothetical protein